MDLHKQHLQKLHVHEREQYILVHDQRETFMINFKTSFEDFMNAHSDTKVRLNKPPSVGKGSQMSSSSSLASKRLEAEEKRIELEAKKQALQKRREIEMAKIALQMEEEELNIKTDIAVADAKVRAYDIFERGEMGITTPAEVKIETRSINAPKSSQLNPHAETFIPVQEEVKHKLDVTNYLPQSQPVSCYPTKPDINTKMDTNSNSNANKHDVMSKPSYESEMT